MNYDIVLIDLTVSSVPTKMKWWDDTEWIMQQSFMKSTLPVTRRRPEASCFRKTTLWWEEEIMTSTFHHQLLVQYRSGFLLKFSTILKSGSKQLILLGRSESMVRDNICTACILTINSFEPHAQKEFLLTLPLWRPARRMRMVPGVMEDRNLVSLGFRLFLRGRRASSVG